MSEQFSQKDCQSYEFSLPVIAIQNRRSVCTLYSESRCVYIDFYTDRRVFRRVLIEFVRYGPGLVSIEPGPGGFFEKLCFYFQATSVSPTTTSQPRTHSKPRYMQLDQTNMLLFVTLCYIV